MAAVHQPPADPSPCWAEGTAVKGISKVPLSDDLPSAPHPHQGSSLLGSVCPGRPQGCGAPSVLGLVGMGVSPSGWC